jgi:hypothetical protein
VNWFSKLCPVWKGHFLQGQRFRGFELRPCFTCWMRRRESCRNGPPTGNSSQHSRSPSPLASRRKHASHCAVHPGLSPRGTSLAMPQPPPARWNDNTGYHTGHFNLHPYANVRKFENARGKERCVSIRLQCSSTQSLPTALTEGLTMIKAEIWDFQGCECSGLSSG